MWVATTLSSPYSSLYSSLPRRHSDRAPAPVLLLWSYPSPPAAPGALPPLWMRSTASRGLYLAQLTRKPREEELNRASPAREEGEARMPAREADWLAFAMS